MEENEIQPTEVIFTSLLSFAGRLIKTENKSRRIQQRHNSSEGIEVYVEIMKNLMSNASPSFSSRRVLSKSNKKSLLNIADNDPSTQLMRVFLVFQEMKGTGARPDIAAYNALLLACSRAGDIERAKDVFMRLQYDGLDPNWKSWGHLLKTASVAGRSDFASSTWNYALNFSGKHNKNYIQWHPDLKSFQYLIEAYLRDAGKTKSVEKKRSLYENILAFYKSLALGIEAGGMSDINIEDIHDNQRTVIQILTAAVSLYEISGGRDSKVYSKADNEVIAVKLVKLPCVLVKQVPRHALRQIKVAQSLARAC